MVGETFPFTCILALNFSFYLPQVLDVWFGRTVIRSCARLSYDDATALLETPHGELDSLASRISIQGPFSLSSIKRSITYLDMVSAPLNDP